jgi:hypothetical protein
MKMWLDDIRPMPSEYDIHAKTAAVAIALLDDAEAISLDHDLGADENGTGYDVACEIEKRAANGIKPPMWKIHSANPVGRKNMEMALIAAQKLFSKER